MGKRRSPKLLTTFKKLTTRFAKLRPKPLFTFSEAVEHWQKLAGMCVVGGQWRIHWPRRSVKVSASPQKLPFAIIVSQLGDNEPAAQQLVKLSLKLGLWEETVASQAYPWHAYAWGNQRLCHTLAQRWAVREIKSSGVFLTAAYQTLGNLPKTPTNIRRLTTALEQPDPYQRVAAIQPLAQLLGAEALPLLAQLLNDPSSQVRSETVASLMRLNTAPAHEILKDHLAHETHLPLRADIAKHLNHLGVLPSSE